MATRFASAYEEDAGANVLPYRRSPKPTLESRAQTDQARTAFEEVLTGWLNEDLFRESVEGWLPLLRREFPQAANRDDPHHESIEAQVDELREFAAEENDRFDEASAAAALHFCHELAADHEPAINLLANGNLRAVWQNQARDQIGIQFFADGLLQFVMLRDRAGRTLKALGEDISAAHVRATVEAQGMIGLWFNGGR